MVFLHITLAAIMFALGLGLSAADFAAVGRHPRAAAVGLVGQLVLLPLVALGVASVFELTGPLAVGLVLIATCPGGAHSNLFASLARGDTALSVALTAISGLLVLGTLPLWMGLALASFGSDDAALVALPVGETVVQILGLLGVPLAMGMGVRAMRRGLALRLVGWVRAVAVVLLLVIVVGSVAKSASDVAGFVAEVGPAVLVLHVGSMALGGALAVAAKLQRAQTVTVILEVGVQNSVLAVGLGMGVLGDTAYAVPAIVYSLLVYATAGVVVTVARWTASEVP